MSPSDFLIHPYMTKDKLHHSCILKPSSRRWLLEVEISSVLSFLIPLIYISVQEIFRSYNYHRCVLLPLLLLILSSLIILTPQ